MALKRRCKVCGRMFEAATANEAYCGGVCRATGLFMGGGGDTTKPMSEERRKELERAKRKSGEAAVSSQRKGGEEVGKRVRGGLERFPRVAEMFRLPVSERARISATFTSEEAECARRVVKKMLMEERLMDEICSWDGGMEERDELGRFAGLEGGSIGESDDGSV